MPASEVLDMIQRTPIFLWNVITFLARKMLQLIQVHQSSTPRVNFLKPGKTCSVIIGHVEVVRAISVLGMCLYSLFHRLIFNLFPQGNIQWTKTMCTLSLETTNIRLVKPSSASSVFPTTPLLKRSRNPSIQGLLLCLSISYIRQAMPIVDVEEGKYFWYPTTTWDTKYWFSETERRKYRFINKRSDPQTSQVIGIIKWVLWMSNTLPWHPAVQNWNWCHWLSQTTPTLVSFQDKTGLPWIHTVGRGVQLGCVFVSEVLHTLSNWQTWIPGKCTEQLKQFGEMRQLNGEKLKGVRLKISWQFCLSH